MKTGLGWKVIKWLLIGVCLFWLIRLLSGGIPNPKTVWAAIVNIPWYWQAAALLSATANWWLETVKWRLLVANLEKLNK